MPETNDPECRHCGHRESEHCTFEAVSRPDGCVCDASTWGEVIPPICDAYVGDGKQYCGTCEHNKECHA